ncbi:MAG: hypothetical protein HOB40_02895 [Candidatus Marinimicrobia bacterium]|nr:hypothetical protein [Candidatus Neomarinimicrobiota bacterium]MBT4958190.1 hypothetical protein [Candidatus Neomarinimicrobiota bacterium]MBT6631894.1 hypothetical protein [Candidatus Neomarinimicrobiota bacterium]MBT7113855.1 hypothetical protein [Candidatus Neomarinimicrobiota bacterium]MBT7822454.1 hypothetical protein [Candidatus Neomarinimicrobiota bacterium]
MRFLRKIFIGVLLLSSLSARGVFHVHGSYDLDKDGVIETLILNTRTSSASWVEITNSSITDTVWSYLLPNGQSFNDVEVLDINGDGYNELVAIVDLPPSVNDQSWLYVFLGKEGGFDSAPLTLGYQSAGLKIIRPSNLSLVPGGFPKLSVGFGATLRQAMVFNIVLSDDEISLSNIQMLEAPIIRNGYGVVYTGGFISHESNYLTTISPEGDKLKIALFDVSQNFKHIRSEQLPIDNAQNLLGADIQAFQSKTSDTEGLLIPFGSDDVYLLEVVGGNPILSNTNLSNKKLFPIIDEISGSMLSEIISMKTQVEVTETLPSVLRHTNSRAEMGVLPIPSASLADESATLNSIPMIENKDYTSLPDGQDETFNLENDATKKQKKYDVLTPTLGDFLASVKKDLSDNTDPIDKTSIPNMNKEMESVTWADEAGFTRLNLGDYIPENVENDSIVSLIPERDKGVSTFSETVHEALVPDEVNSDTVLDMQSINAIDLYYVLAMTPASDTKDRYVFDGEAPFGISVNQLPPMGTATHFQHGISANLANLKRGDTFDFAYSLRDARLDSITTLTMVHDMQTNVVFMSISPNQDSLSQSYEPEAFDPNLFEFPDYFFEGFPTSLDMDFTDKLIRFSFDGIEDSTYQGIYLSSTTPSNPSQSLAVFMDEGTLQAIRGEVVVRANGSKKVTTEFDLVGHVEPAVMFSRLIQEMFPNELKIKLLQGASLEGPLFGPVGKLPTVTREPRLPEAQPDQASPDIPVEPKQSNVPSEKKVVTKDESMMNPNIVEPQEDEVSTNVLEVLKSEIDVPVLIDTLKLENRKDTKLHIQDGSIPETEISQPDNELEKETINLDENDENNR